MQLSKWAERALNGHLSYNEKGMSLSKADIQGLIEKATPESETLEFKRELPAKGTDVDPWSKGSDRIGDYARDRLLKEIIALANTSGGRLIIGIDESDEEPARAKEIRPIQRCALLAERLAQQIDSLVDPVLPIMKTYAVPLGAEDGVVVIDVGRSPQAPHRHSTTGQVFVRRGTRTATLGMREVQDLTLLRFIGQMPAKAELERLAKEWAKRVSVHASAFPGIGYSVRIAVVPTLGGLNLDDLRGRTEWQGLWVDTRVGDLETEHQLAWPISGMNEAPCLGGVLQYIAGHQAVSRRIFRSGSVQVESTWQLEAGPSTVFSPWVLMPLASALWAWEGYKSLTNAVGVEATVECDVRTWGDDFQFGVHNPATRYLNRTYPLPPGGIEVRGHSYTTRDDIPGLFFGVARDLHNACGADLTAHSFSLRSIGTHRFVSPG